MINIGKESRCSQCFPTKNSKGEEEEEEEGGGGGGGGEEEEEGSHSHKLSDGLGGVLWFVWKFSCIKFHSLIHAYMYVNDAYNFIFTHQ